jgi:hypothetical protein
MLVDKDSVEKKLKDLERKNKDELNEMCEKVKTLNHQSVASI